jgi:hypothetical protein
MAWTVIFGLIFATFLTLVIVPVMYFLSDKVTVGVKKVAMAEIDTNIPTNGEPSRELSDARVELDSSKE